MVPYWSVPTRKKRTCNTSAYGRAGKGYCYKFLASTRRDSAFISKGFTYCKEGPKAFKKHQESECHREAVDALIILPHCTMDVGEQASVQHQVEKAVNREMLLLVLQNVRFLVRQGLRIRSEERHLDYFDWAWSYATMMQNLVYEHIAVCHTHNIGSHEIMYNVSWQSRLMW